MIRGKKFELNESDRIEIRNLEIYENRTGIRDRAAALIAIGMLIWGFSEYWTGLLIFGDE